MPAPRIPVLVLAALSLALPATAAAHPERDTQFPDASLGSVPEVRTNGPAQVVCKTDSGDRIRQAYGLSASGNATARRSAHRTRGHLRAAHRRGHRRAAHRRAHTRARHRTAAHRRATHRVAHRRRAARRRAAHRRPAHVRAAHRRAHRRAAHRRAHTRAEHRTAAHRRATHRRMHRRNRVGSASLSPVQREGRERLRLLEKCRFQHIQAAVDAASSGDRILILPGVYREEPSRAVKFVGPEADRDQNAQGGGAGGGLDPSPGGLQAFLAQLGLTPRAAPEAEAAQAEGGTCDSMKEFEEPADGDAPVPNYRFQFECPNSRNLIAVIGDTDGDRKCDRRCDLQIEGMGRRPQDVLIVGDRIKRDVIRGDRADGLTIRNMTVEQGAFNNIDLVETNGFRIEDIETRYAQNYGVLTFTTDHGLYQRIDAHGNGDSGVYPGSGPEGHCERYGIEIRDVYSHDNVLGYSGTAGNGVYTHDSVFEDNSTGIATDSFASGHPGMPQDCAKWENNRISSNNQNFFAKDIQEFCAKTPFEKRPREAVCPQFQVPVGTGIIMAGANDNIVRGNSIFDNWRDGVLLLYVPATVRGDDEPEKQTDTSNGNSFVENIMGVRPDGTRDPNGVDFLWDEQGRGNCWEGNKGPGGAATKNDPQSLPDCKDQLNKQIQRPVNASKSAREAPCATWNPQDNQFPPGCDWFDTPTEPR